MAYLTRRFLHSLSFLHLFHTVDNSTIAWNIPIVYTCSLLCTHDIDMTWFYMILSGHNSHLKYGCMKASFLDIAFTCISIIVCFFSYLFASLYFLSAFFSVIFGFVVFFYVICRDQYICNTIQSIFLTRVRYDIKEWKLFFLTTPIYYSFAGNLKPFGGVLLLKGSILYY